MKISVQETALFGVVGGIMFVSALIMSGLPNIHLIGVFIVALTVVYRRKALYPIYVFVFLQGIMAGFSVVWFANLYIWAVLWGAVMFLPERMSEKARPIIYMLVCGAHGLIFGILYAPVWALSMGLDFKGMLMNTFLNFGWDLLHGLGNFCLGILICPIIKILKRTHAT